jgi:murein DD-endopeptidase MepM/ murein hydrolase activator NlpD
MPAPIYLPQRQNPFMQLLPMLFQMGMQRQAIAARERASEESFTRQQELLGKAAELRGDVSEVPAGDIGLKESPGTELRGDVSEVPAGDIGLKESPGTRIILGKKGFIRRPKEQKPMPTTGWQLKATKDGTLKWFHPQLKGSIPTGEQVKQAKPSGSRPTSIVQQYDVRVSELRKTESGRKKIRSGYGIIDFIKERADAMGYNFMDLMRDILSGELGNLAEPGINLDERIKELETQRQGVK